LWIDEFDEVSPLDDGTKTGSGRPWGLVKNEYPRLTSVALVDEGWNVDVGDAERPFVWVRGMTAGGQRSATLWSGDLDATEAEMKLQVRGMIAAGLSAFPYWGHDAGGFLADQVPLAQFEALYQSWAFALGSVTPYWKPHGQGPSRWPLDRPAASQVIAERFSELRYRLLPYLYDSAQKASETGAPMVRPLFWNDPSNADLWSKDTEFYVGGDLLAMTPLAGLDRYVPKGRWYDFFDEYRIDGPATLTDAQVAALPLYVRAGAIVPMSELAEGSAFQRKEVLDVHVYAGADGSLDFAEDDGRSEAYSKGARARTSFTWSDADKRLSIAPVRGTYDGAPTAREYRLHLHGLDAPACVRLAGLVDALPYVTSEADAIARAPSAAWSVAGRGGVLTVALPARATSDSQQVAFAPSGCALPTVVRAEAEGAATTGVRGNKPRASQGAYIGGLDAVGKYVEYTVSVPATGTYALRLGYASGGGVASSRTLSVDGAVVEDVYLAPHATWSEYFPSEARPVVLTAGAHKIRVATTEGQPAVDLDWLSLTGPVIERPAFSFAGSSLLIPAWAFHRRVDRGNRTFRAVTTPRDFTGAGAVRAWPNAGAQIEAAASATAPSLEYRVQFPEPGRYYVWVRGQAQGSVNDDSAHVALDGAAPTSAAGIVWLGASRWTWSKTTMAGPGAYIDVPSAGEHTVRLIMREDGALVDGFALSRDAAFTP
jgi:hypothetical protein